MNRYFIAIVFSLAIVTMISCKSRKSASGAAEDGSTAFTKIAEGNYCGVETASTMLIRSQEEWKSLWEKVTANRSPVPTLPEVNFDENLILAVFSGTQNSGGHTIEIQRVAMEKGKYQVNVLQTKPGSGCFVTDVLTQPYYIASVAKGKILEAEFSTETVATPCK
ncbi:MAG: protease complex subunit PrcB family protein [Bacteroidia bacterium]